MDSLQILDLCSVYFLRFTSLVDHWHTHILYHFMVKMTEEGSSLRIDHYTRPCNQILIFLLRAYHFPFLYSCCTVLCQFLLDYNVL